MSKKIKIGFDLGNDSLKIMALKNGKWEFYELPLPEHIMEDDVITMPNAFSAFLKKIKKELHLPKGPAALLLPASQVICRLVSMPYMSEEQLMLNLPYEFNDFIHGEPHQYHCDYALCDTVMEEGQETPTELTMMAAAVEKQQVSAYVNMFASGGFSIQKMLPQEMGLIQLVQAYRMRNEHTPDEYCFMDLGYLSTRVFVVQNDKMQITRRIPVGGKDLDAIVADILHVDQFVAGSYKRGNHQGILEHNHCMELYEHLAVEVLKLINFYHFTYRQSQLQGIYLIGGGAGIASVCSILESSLGLPILPVEELMPNLNVSDKTQPKHNFACVMGLLADLEEEE